MAERSGLLGFRIQGGLFRNARLGLGRCSMLSPKGFKVHIPCRD